MFSSARHSASSVPQARRRALGVTGAILAGLAAGTLFVSSATARSSARATRNAAPFQTDVDALVAAGAPGAILLVRDGKTTTTFTAGVADTASQTAMQPGDHYRIASLTKSYVATVVLQLVAEGKLKLNDSVNRWLPGLLRQGTKITIRMLLNHTSGLYDHEKDAGRESASLTNLSGDQ